MSTYEWYLFLHIGGAFLLLAATGATTGSGIALGRTTSAPVAATLLKIMRMSEYIVRSAGAVLVILFGALLVNETDRSFGEAWISAALTIVIIALAVAHGFLLPRAKRSLRVAESLGDGPVSPELERMLKDPVTGIVGTILDLMFFVILWLMIAKPGE